VVGGTFGTSRTREVSGIEAGKVFEDPALVGRDAIDLKFLGLRPCHCGPRERDVVG